MNQLIIGAYMSPHWRLTKVYGDIAPRNVMDTILKIRRLSHRAPLLLPQWTRIFIVEPDAYLKVSEYTVIIYKYVCLLLCGIKVENNKGSDRGERLNKQH